jgi:hypothetical protein
MMKMFFFVGVVVFVAFVRRCYIVKVFGCKCVCVEKQVEEEAVEDDDEQKAPADCFFLLSRVL